MQRDQSGPKRGGPRLSVVIPAYNEKESLPLLYAQVRDVLRREDYEIIFVDDGSTDGTEEYLRQLCGHESRVKAVRFHRNFGKSAALQAGFAESRGEIIVTMDADLQDDPEEIPRLLGALEGGYDMVSGWRGTRKDPLNKTLPSELFNAVTGFCTKVQLHDFNCGFKAYRRAVVQNLRIYGEQHRFIPALAYWQGFRVGEVQLTHHPRRFGHSKFGMRRFLSGFLDLFTILFLTRFRFKPLHVFGSVGSLLFLAGLAINAYLTWIKLQGQAIGTRPLLSLGIMLLVMGIQIFGIGLLAELITLVSAREVRLHRAYEVLSGTSRAAPLPPGRPPQSHRTGPLRVAGQQSGAQTVVPARSPGNSYRLPNTKAGPRPGPQGPRSSNGMRSNGADLSKRKGEDRRPTQSSEAPQP